MKIREFREGDRGAVDEMQFALQWYFAEVDTSGETRGYESLEEAHRYMETMIGDARKMEGKVLVAEEEGELVGFAQGVIVEHDKGEDAVYDLNHHMGKQGWIGLLFVKPECQGKGYGKDLVDAMVEYFKSKGCTSVKLLVLAENNAVKFYRKYGFRDHEVEMTLRLD